MPKRRNTDNDANNSNYPKYSIAIVAELTGMHPQQIRRYEQMGLLAPSRSPKGTRRYSDADLQRLERIGKLADEGINLAGMEYIFSLQEQVIQAEERADIAEARAEAAESQIERDKAENRNENATQ
jgi:MerR family transcriptional regulator/heat shock protein HspR